MQRSDLQTLARRRLEEAQHLLDGGYSSGAFYLGGYAVECAVKAWIAKATQEFEFPDKSRWNKAFTHNLRDLLKLADTSNELDGADKALRSNWDYVSQAWSEETRYSTWTDVQAKALLLAIADVRNGVLPWIENRW